MLGGAIGDALSAPAVTPGEASSDHPGRRGLLRYTGDTQMTLHVAQSLIECRGFDGAHMAAALAGGFAAEPWRGYGDGPSALLRRLGQALSSEKAGDDHSEETSFGGDMPAVRVAPVALFTCPRLPEAAWIGRQVALLTVTAPSGLDGAILQACALTLLLQVRPDVSPDMPRLLGMLRTPLHGSSLTEELDRLGRRLYSGRQPDRLVGDTADAGGDPVTAALLSFFRNSHSFGDVVTNAIGLGGTTAPTGTLAGALAGAYLGEESIPSSWRDHVDGAARLRDLADDLLDLAGRGISVRSARRLGGR